jgi:HAE1 family hydrophobic/amphiphilic exporter-1
MLAPIDVVAAEAQVSGFEESVYSALEDVGRAENNLKNMIAENRQSRIWGQSLLPTDPVDLQPPSIALDDALKTALENRPEVQQLQVSREINQIDQKFYKDQTKPQVDLVGTYGVTGLTGAQNPLGANPLTQQNQELRAQVNLLSAIAGLPPVPEPPPATLPASALGGLGSSLSELAQSRFPNFRVGVQIGIPIRNRTAEGELGRALVTGQQIATQREQLEQNIQVEVRNALQVVRTAQSRLRSAAAARSASEQQYTSEQRKFDAGQSTLFLVLERQTALTTARGNELRAQTDLNKAIADFQRATGNALQVNNVVARVR